MTGLRGLILVVVVVVVGQGAPGQGQVKVLTADTASWNLTSCLECVLAQQGAYLVTKQSDFGIDFRKENRRKLQEHYCIPMYSTSRRVWVATGHFSMEDCLDGRVTRRTKPAYKNQHFGIGSYGGANLHDMIENDRRLTNFQNGIKQRYGRVEVVVRVVRGKQQGIVETAAATK